MQRPERGQFVRKKAPGLTINTTSPVSPSYPINIPTTRPTVNRNSVESLNDVSFDQDQNDDESFAEISDDSLSRSIGTQTPTDSMSFEYPIPCLMLDMPEKCLEKRRTGLFGQHSFKEEGEKSWFPMSDWFGFGSGASTRSRFSRTSRIRRSIVISSHSSNPNPTPTLHFPPSPASSSTSIHSFEDFQGIGRTLRSIGDDLDKQGYRRLVLESKRESINPII